MYWALLLDEVRNGNETSAVDQAQIAEAKRANERHATDVFTMIPRRYRLLE